MSEMKIKNGTNQNPKVILLIVIIYVSTFIDICVQTKMEYELHMETKIEYVFYAYILKVLFYIVISVLLILLSEIPKCSVVLEVLMIDLPSILMISSFFVCNFIPYNWPQLLWINSHKIGYIGALIVGTEIIRIIKRKKHCKKDLKK